MGNQYENQEFRNAAMYAGVKGRRWDNPNVKAISECSRAFHNAMEKWERETLSFDEIVQWCQDWWIDKYDQYDDSD